MDELRQITLIIFAAAALAACGPGGTSSGAGRPRPAAATSASRATPSYALTPSIPGVFRTGVNHCGAPYAVNATTVHGTVPLLDCPGLAGLRPTPTVRVGVGDQVLVSGLPHSATLSMRPADLVTRRGTTFLAVEPGRTVLTIHNVLCLPPPGRKQPRSCALLVIRST